jgi:hypothetical protein
VGFGLFLIDNPALEHLNGLATLGAVAGSAVFERNNVMNSVAGLTGLQLQNNLQLRFNDGLCQSHAEQVASTMHVGGSSDVSSNSGSCQ